MVIFLDTYALIEIDQGNPSYKEIIVKPRAAITSVLNLIELHFVYSKKFNKEEASRILKLIRPLVIRFGDDIIIKATEIKLQYPEKRLSFADCIGYAVASKFKAMFITGDYAFKDMPSVLFIK